jgi:hypothetical protein
MIMGRTCYVILVFDACGIVCFPFYILFVKALRWGVTRSTQPHVLMCMFCPYVISTPLATSYLKSHKCELPKDTFLMHSSHNFTPKRNELRYHCCLSQLYFTGH